MEFDENKPIYLQIADRLCDEILAGKLRPEDRIPSVREWGASIGVNPNTVVRSYEILSDKGIIYNKRGIGFFVCSDARKMILKSQREAFLNDELPRFVAKAELLEINLKEFIK